MKINQKDMRISPFTVYVTLSVVMIVLSCFFLAKNRGMYLDSLIDYQGNDRFMDFFNHISYTMNNGLNHVYEANVNACFPPLSYLFYYFCGLILPDGSTVMLSAADTSAYAMLLFCVRCVALAILFYAAIALQTKNGRMTLVISLLIVLSNVFIFRTLERGNPAWLVCIMLMAAMGLRNSENRTAREMALILIAVAAGFKIYPAFFGLLYLAEKRWKEAIRLVVYGILFFFVPFAFCGGIGGLQQFFNNTVEIQSTHGSSIGNYWHFSGVLQGITKSGFPFYPIITVLLTLLSTVGVFLLKEQWKKQLLLCGLMILTPKWSGGYTMCYAAIPLVAFLTENKGSRGDLLRAGLFALVFSLLIFRANQGIPVLNMQLPDAIVYTAFWLLMLSAHVETVVCTVRKFRGRKLAEQGANG